MNNIALPIGVFFIAVLAGVALMFLPAKAPTPGSAQAVEGESSTTPSARENDTLAGIPDLILVGTPTNGAEVSSPITITGSARGTWYFEASFPIDLRDASGKVIAQSHAEAQSDWMTENFVTFKATLAFPQQPAGSHGTLVLHKDNPSGDPARDQSVSIPVVFK